MKKQDEKIINRRKRRGKRRLRRLAIVTFVMLIIIAFLIGAVYFLADRYLSVKDVIVCGSSIYSSDEITKAADISITGGDNMIFLRTFSISDKIEKSLPYISEVTLYREFPDTIIVEVTPAQVFAQMNSADLCVLVDKNEKVLEQVDTSIVTYDYLSVKTTSEEKQTVGEHFAFSDSDESRLFDKISDASEEYNLIEKMSSIDVTDKYDINLMYDNRIAIQCGDYSDISDKIRFAATIISKRGESEKGTVDVMSTEKASFTISRG